MIAAIRALIPANCINPEIKKKIKTTTRMYTTQSWPSNNIAYEKVSSKILSMFIINPIPKKAKPVTGAYPKPNTNVDIIVKAPPIKQNIFRSTNFVHFFNYIWFKWKIFHFKY